MPKTTPETGNVYDEYMYINSAFELVGDTSVDLSGYLKSTDIAAWVNELNVDKLYPLTSGTYYNLSTAVAAIPAELRSVNAKITFTSASGIVENWQFIGSVGDWLTITNWEKITDGLFNLTFTTDAPTTRLLVPSANRKYGTMISYNNGTDLITEQYIGADVTDANWQLDSNWIGLVLNDKFSIHELNNKIAKLNITCGNNLLNKNYIEPQNPKEYEKGGKDRLINQTTGVVVSYAGWYLSPLMDWGTGNTQSIITNCRC